MNLPAYRKTMAAVVGAALTWGTVVVTSDTTRVTASEWLLLAGSLATAFGVYATPNEDTPADDAGQSGINTVISVMALIIIVVFAWWFISKLVSTAP